MNSLIAYAHIRARESVTPNTVPESALERKLFNGLRKCGALCLKFVSPGNPGVPDRVVVFPGGRVVFVELKSERGALSVRQRWQIERLRGLGAEVRVLRGVEQVREFVEEVSL